MINNKFQILNGGTEPSTIWDFEFQIWNLFVIPIRVRRELDRDHRYAIWCLSFVIFKTKNFWHQYVFICIR